MKKFVFVILFFASATAFGKKLTTQDYLGCLNKMHEIMPSLMQPGYTRASDSAHYLFFKSPQIGGNPEGQGYFRLSPEGIQFCYLNYPNRRNFKFMDGNEAIYYQTSDKSDPTPLEQLTAIQPGKCKTNSDVSGAGTSYMQSQIATMAERVGELSGKTLPDLRAALTAKGQACSKIPLVAGTVDGKLSDGYYSGPGGGTTAPKSTTPAQ